MLRTIALAMIATLALLSASGVNAAKKPRPPRPPRCKADGRKCSGNDQCCSGGCSLDHRCTSDPNACRLGEDACDTFCCNVLAGETCCDQPPYGLHCVDKMNDRNNCGGCGTQCPDSEVCKAGSCGCPADAPTKCEFCTDTKTDHGNCGSCGHACGASESCVEGQCVAVCPPCAELKDGACVPKACSCGSCDAATGQCPTTCECPPCEELHDGVCIPKACPCGSCDANTGECVSECGGGQVCCSDVCVNSRQPPGGTCCTKHDGTPFACGPTEQCAGDGYCCSAGAQVCVGSSGYPQCCGGGSVCVQLVGGLPSCCFPGLADPQQCCDQPGCMPKECCRPQ